jgi:hypothetical protein
VFSAKGAISIKAWGNALGKKCVLRKEALKAQLKPPQ